MNKKTLRVLSSKYWKVNNTSNKIIDALDLLLNDVNTITMPNVKQLSNLFLNEDIKTTKFYFIEYNKLTPSKKRSRTLKNFILYHGNKIGKQKWNEYNNKLKNSVSKEGYIERYGEVEGVKKYNEYTNLLSKKGLERVKREGKLKQRERSRYCIEYWVKKGYTKEEAKTTISKIQSNNSIKYHSSIIDKEHYKKINPICVEYWIDKGYDIDTANKKRQEILNKCNVSLPFMINRHGETLGKLKYDKMLLKRKDAMIKLIKEGKINFYNGKASKESLQYFLPLNDILINDYNIDSDDIFFGYEDKNEFYLASGDHRNSNSYYYLYDFTIRSKKIIIEYNGSRWHPNPDILSEKEWKNWNVGNVTADEKYKRDIDKLETAYKKGFKCLVIWDYNGYDNNMSKILSFIKENLND